MTQNGMSTIEHAHRQRRNVKTIYNKHLKLIKLQ